MFALVGAACAPPLTKIPTYWAPQLTVRQRLADIMPPDPPTVPPKRPRVAVVPKAPPRVLVDKPKECMSIYLVSLQNNILAYNPLDNAIDERGALDCPAGFAHPFSMGVTRTGTAHVVYSDGRLYQVDLDDMTCKETGFAPNQDPGFWQFGMGYAPTGGDGESLFVAEISHVRPSKGLARVDTETGQLHYIGAFSLNPGFDIELTPTGDGPLYGFFLNAFAPGGTLVEIDTDNAIIKRSYHVDVGSQSQSLAVAWWGGQFYIFTTFGGGSAVHRFNPKTEKVARVAILEQRIVGAGVSTCAPNASEIGEQASASDVLR